MCNVIGFVICVLAAQTFTSVASPNLHGYMQTSKQYFNFTMNTNRDFHMLNSDSRSEIKKNAFLNTNDPKFEILIEKYNRMLNRNYPGKQKSNIAEVNNKVAMPLRINRDENNDFRPNLNQNQYKMKEIRKESTVLSHLPKEQRDEMNKRLEDIMEAGVKGRYHELNGTGMVPQQGLVKGHYPEWEKQMLRKHEGKHEGPATPPSYLARFVRKKHKVTIQTTIPRRTAPKRETFEEDCKYLAYYCYKAYDTGEMCARTFFYTYHTFINYCMMDYVNCMEKYEVWQIAHMGACFPLKYLSEYLHYGYDDEYFLDLYYQMAPL